MKAAWVPDEALPPLNDALPGAGMTARQKRLLQLATIALAEVLADVNKPLPLFLAGPETLPGCAPACPGRFLQWLAMQTNEAFDVATSRLFATGRAGGIQALNLATRYFESTRSHFALVGGVDSYRDMLVLNKLHQEGRILSTGAGDAFAPGEAACFLLLATAAGVRATGSKPLGVLSPAALAEEPGHRYSDEPYRGDGLAEAWRGALGQGNGTPVRSVFSTFNGEQFAAREFAVAATRNADRLDESLRHEHPADCFGDLGAAAGPVLIALAAIGMQKGYYARPALVSCSADQAPRAAVYLSV